MEQFKEGWYYFFFKGLIKFRREIYQVLDCSFLGDSISPSISFCAIDLFR
jgi:hypothetical protein